MIVSSAFVTVHNGNFYLIVCSCYIYRLTATEFPESGLSSEELTKKVFESLANGKEHITSKDLRNWDLIHIMLAEVG